MKIIFNLAIAALVVSLAVLAGASMSGCATVNYLYEQKQCRQIGGSFVKNEVYLACPLYDKKQIEEWQAEGE